MLTSLYLFIKHLETHLGYAVSRFSKKDYQALLTGLSTLPDQPVVVIPEMAALARAYPGSLLVDDTNNPKYGLKHVAQGLYFPGTQAHRLGYKVVLLLWNAVGLGRVPVGFALCHQGTETPAQLALKGLSLLRNRYHLKPQRVLADGAYSTNALIKRVTDYGWPCIVRIGRDRKLDGKPVRRLIPRGYGTVCGKLKNGTPLKIVRSGKHFLASNRMMLEGRVIRNLYAIRWKIEEVFRALKSCIGLEGCQQHSMRAQAVYILLCLLLFSSLELYSGGKPYKAFAQVISRRLDPQHIVSALSTRLC